MVKRSRNRQQTGWRSFAVALVGLLIFVALAWDNLPRSSQARPKPVPTRPSTPSNTSEDFIKFDGLPRENAEGLVEIEVVVTGPSFERSISIWVEFGGVKWPVCSSPSTVARLKCHFDPKGKNIPHGAIIQTYVEMSEGTTPLALLQSGVIWNPNPR